MGRQYQRGARDRIRVSGNGRRGLVMGRTDGSEDIVGYVHEIQSTSEQVLALVGHQHYIRLAPDAATPGRQGVNYPIRGGRYQDLDATETPTGIQYPIVGEIALEASGILKFRIEKGGARR